MRWLPRLRYWNFYPRSPRGERPWQVNVYEPTGLHFYPRSPRGERRATPLLSTTPTLYFYPRSPRGERLFYFAVACIYCNFYPRSPRGERPLLATGNEIMRNLFLSTLPARGATRSLSLSSAHTRISIHAPREGSDLLQRFEAAQFMYNFYPRSPRGERLTLLSAQCAHFHFYPRSPRGERLRGFRLVLHRQQISIHAPREGSDSNTLPIGRF